MACFILLAAPVLCAQDMSQTVLPLSYSKLKIKKKSYPSSLGWSALVPKAVPAVETDLATGFCLDPECRLIGTNYHFAAMGQPGRIKGSEVIQSYLATGPDDEEATLNDIFSDRPMKYALLRDLAIFELRRPIPHHRGISFSLEDLEIDQPVDIYAYPKKSIDPRRSLLQFHGEFKGNTAQGFLAFEYSSSNGKTIRGGASGGLIVDAKTHQAVGVLCRVGIGANGKTAALAVPIQSLADFVSKVQPWLSERIFPSATRETISPTMADIYPKFVWPSPTGMLQHRPEEPADVKALREKAQNLADSMRNFVAVQTFAWGSRKADAPVAVAAYEVQVVDGFQRFRDLKSEKEFRDMPLPPVNTVVGTGGEWSELPQTVGTALQLKIHQFPDTVVNGKLLKVFQYRADVEDGVPCNFFRIVRDFGFLTASKIVSVPCYGEVWTDEDMNILRISEHIEVSGGAWRDRGTVVTYGWLRRTGEAPRLVPLTISAEAEYHNKVYWCRGNFQDYRIFKAQTRIVANEQETATGARPGIPQ